MENAQPGPKNIPPDVAESRLKLFLLFFGDFFNSSILPLSQQRAAEREETRKMAREDPSSSTSNAPSHHRTAPFTLSNLYLFLATSIAMGFSVCAREQDYWKKGDAILGNSYIESTMSWESYHEIKKSLCVKVEDLVPLLRKKFTHFWEPYSDVVIDESLVLTKARCPYTVVIPRKPHRVGVKIWSLVDRSRFLYALSLYKKKPESTTGTLLRMASFLPPARQFAIRADAYFGSIDAAEGLDQEGHFYTLACRKDRPSAIFGRHLHSQEIPMDSSATIYKAPTREGERPMAAITFRQKKTDGEKVINFVSNLYAGEKSVQKKNGERAVPDVVQDYSLHMGYVDQVDSACLQFRYPHRLINWKHALFFWLLEATVHNMWIMWNHLHPNEREDWPTFRRAMADTLRAAGQGLSSLEHRLVKLPKRRKCSVCRKRNINSNTTLCCLACGNLPLHKNCYVIMHPPQLHSNGRKRKNNKNSDHDNSTGGGCCNADNSQGDESCVGAD